MKTLPLYGTYLVALIDDEDYEKCKEYSWYMRNRLGYPTTNINGKETALHNYLLGCLWVDHKDHNTLNNQKDNLRKATKTQNKANSKKYRSYAGKKTSSKFKGVCFCKNNNRYRAYISCGWTRHHLGYFLTEIQAANAYNVAATKYFGEFAVLNIINRVE